jgi:hypothetical protein
VSGMTYFLAGLAGLVAFSGASGFAFGGRPLPGTLRSISNVVLSYNASFVMGFIPALKILNLAALRFIPKISAISLTVYPSIFIISDFTKEKLLKIVRKLHLLKICLVKEKKIIKNSPKTTKYVDNKVIQGLQYKHGMSNHPCRPGTHSSPKGYENGRLT